VGGGETATSGAVNVYPPPFAEALPLALIRNKSGGSEMVCDPVVELFGCRVGGEAQDVST
jgi:hypothetical protein